MTHFFERLFFNPKWYHFGIIFLLLPFSFLYGTLLFLKRFLSRPQSYALPIISIGNLIVGGSGKTPFAIALIHYLQTEGVRRIFYISRGYGRRSKGMVLVKVNDSINCKVEESGDEALLVAKSTDASVIVSENRQKAIKKAKELGAELIILDDAFSKSAIKKYDILLEPAEIRNPFVFPAGPFREFPFVKRYANLKLKEGKDYKRKVSYENLTQRMLLVTAIANPQRLEAFFPENVVGKLYFPDHAYFKKEEIIDKMRELSVTSLLVTQKDYVKLEQFKLPISIIKLKLEIDKNILKRIKEEACKQK